MANNKHLRESVLMDWAPDVAAGLCTEADAIAAADSAYEVPIQGFRAGWVECLILNAPTHKAARAGYLSALYNLRANQLPPAFVRQPDTERFQAAIGVAIAAIESGVGLPRTVKG